MVIEATGNSTGELVALSKQWMASHNHTNTASKLTLDKLQLIYIFCSFQSREFSLIRWEETIVCVLPFCYYWHESSRVVMRFQLIKDFNWSPALSVFYMTRKPSFIFLLRSFNFNLKSNICPAAFICTKR